MSWQIDFSEEAIEDLESLDGSQRKVILKGIQKVAENPLPNTEGGLGKPLGNLSEANLSGCLKIKYRKSGLRVVYILRKKDEAMYIIIIAVRDEDYVYKQAAKRLKR